jgi:hypothetical protein
MNKTFVKTVASAIVILLMSSGQGLAQENVLLAQENSNQESDDVVVTKVPVRYEITDDFEDETLTTIFSTMGVQEVDLSNPYVEVYALDGKLTGDRISLFGEQGLLADVFFDPNISDTIIFSHENTVRHGVMGNSWLLSIRDDALQLEVYNAIDDHPLFAELVALIESLDELPWQKDMEGFEAYFDLHHAIANDIVTTYILPELDENGNPIPGPMHRSP